MVRDDKHNDKNPSIRGASRKSEMDLKKKLHKLSGGRPARLKKLLDAELKLQAKELAELQKDLEDKAKAEAEEKKPAKKKSKKSSKKKE